MVPRLTAASIVIRGIFILLSSIIGLYGYLFGAAFLLIHLFDLRSFGVPYMLKTNSYKLDDLKDTAIRAPMWYLQKKQQSYLKTKK